jgi:two-component system sensor histidine kinase QseC
MRPFLDRSSFRLPPSAFSIRHRLLALLLGATVLVWLITAVSSFLEAHGEIDELFDAQLAQSARVLLAEAGHELAEGAGHEAQEIEIERGGEGHRYEQKIAFQVWSKDGRLLLRSASAPSMRMTERFAGFSDAQLDGRHWRVFSDWDDRREFQIQVAERHDIRNELARGIVLRLACPFLFALPLLALLIWAGVGRGLTPLNRIADEVARRAPQRLAPIEAAGAPVEIRPLVDSLNALLQRLEQALEGERRFTADAAHELRTPLAALKTQAQVALRASDDAGRHRALDHVIQGVDRASHLVEQLLTLARLDPEQKISGGEAVKLRNLAAQALTQLAPAAIAKKIDLSLEPGEECTVVGNPAMLEVLLRNLADNAVRYTPEGGKVVVEVIRANARAVLQVTDSGPGIPPEERERIFERFYRGLGTEETGSGLGLSIVRRIAELHGADVTLGEGKGGRGLRVRVAFPRLGG